MNRSHYIFLIFLIVLFVFNPTYNVSAQGTTTPTLDTILGNITSQGAQSSGGFSSNGIYGCNSSSYGAVGAQGPSGSVVPVFDSASFDQQRILTYKACVLDGIASSVQKNLIAQMVKKFVTELNSGRNGNPAFVTNLEQHRRDKIVIPTAKAFITGDATNSITPTFKNDVRTALSKYASNKINTPYKVPGCSLSTEQLSALDRGDFNGAGGWSAFLTRGAAPGCDPLKTYSIARNQLDSAISNKLQQDTTQLNWNNGFLSKVKKETVNIGDGKTMTRDRIVTPGYLIAQQATQVLGTGLRQAENVKQIDQMVSGLMLDINTQMLSSSNGLLGLSSNSSSGGLSYLTQLVIDSAREASNKMVKAATNILNNAIRFERRYHAARVGTNTALANAGTQLTTWDEACRVGLIDQAKTDTEKKVADQVCPGLSSGEVCGVPITVTQQTATNIIIVTAPAANSSVPIASSIVASGRVQQAGSSMTITISNGNKQLSPLQPNIASSSVWATNPIDLASLPDGNIVISATETLSNNTGTIGPITATLTKNTTIKGIVLTLPAQRPAVTITASSGSITESVILGIDASHSNTIISQSIAPLLGAVELDIFKSNNALLVLKNMRDQLALTTSNRGKRTILTQLDVLVAKKLIHSDSDSRAAASQLSNIQTALAQKLATTQTNWKAGWCAPTSWDQYVL